MVVEDRPGDPTQEDQRHEDGDRGEGGAQHRGDHLRRTSVARLSDAHPPRPVLGDILRHDDRAVDHHTQRQDQAGERDDVERQVKQVEEEETGHEADHHAQPDHHRALHVTQEKQRHHADEQEAQREVLLQVRDRIVQQLRLVTGDREINVGIDLSEIGDHLPQCLLHPLHVLVRLLDDGQRHRPLSLRQGEPRLPFRHHLHLRQVLELQESIALSQVDRLHILRRAQQGGEADVIFVIAISYHHTTRIHVVGHQGTLQIGNAQPQHLHLPLIGQDAHLPPHQTGHVHHRHLRQLLDPSLDDLLRQLAEIQEGRLALSPLQGQVQAKNGNIRRAGLHHTGAIQLPRQVIHGRVNLLIHLDKGQVRVRAIVETQPNDRCPITRLAMDVTQARHLHQLLPDGLHHRVLQLPSRTVRPRHLHGDLRDSDVGQERDRQREIGGQPHDEKSGERHQYRNRPLKQKTNHKRILLNKLCTFIEWLQSYRR